MNERNKKFIKAIKELEEVGITYGYEKHRNDWWYLSTLPLPKKFIKKYFDELDLINIIMYQKMSEEFIEDIVKIVTYSSYHNLFLFWNYISGYQKLSEAFIEKYADKVDWYCISAYQQLSEDFINKYSDMVDWENISIYQKLSETFIEKYADKVNWICISIYQKLSENFIRKYKNELNLHDIARHQVISLKFARELGVADVFLRHNNCLKPISYWKKTVKNTGLYECHKDYFYAYKGIRSDRYSCRNFQYQYLPGGTYGCFSDYSDNENSFGLSAWTKEDAEKYCNELVIKVKIYYEDVTAVVHDGGKIRCKKMTVLD